MKREMKMRTIVVGTRESNLARTQTEQVIERLRELSIMLGTPCHFETRFIRTKGDQILNVTLSKVGGKGLFVKEIEQALLDGEIDLAVHSMKDLPFELPEGLTIGAVPKREDVRDVLISRNHLSLDQLPAGAVVGTSSLRREAQLRHLRPDLVVRPLRGNIDTRLRKLEEGEVDAILLAAAGLVRMGWSERITQYLEPDHMIPAVGQGALAVECREGDTFIRHLLSHLQHEETAHAVRAERAFLGALEGSCQVPIGAWATRVKTGEEMQWLLTGMIGSPDGSRIIRMQQAGKDPDSVGIELAQAMLDHGADEILTRVRQS